MDYKILESFWDYEETDRISGDKSTHYYEFWNEVFHHLDPKAFNASLKRAAKQWPEGNAVQFLKSEQYKSATQPTRPIEEPRNHFEADGKAGYWSTGRSGQPIFYRD